MLLSSRNDAISEIAGQGGALRGRESTGQGGGGLFEGEWSVRQGGASYKETGQLAGQGAMMQAGRAARGAGRYDRTMLGIFPVGDLTETVEVDARADAVILEEPEHCARAAAPPLCMNSHPRQPLHAQRKQGPGPVFWLTLL